MTSITWPCKICHKEKGYSMSANFYQYMQFINGKVNTLDVSLPKESGIGIKPHNNIIRDSPLGQYLITGICPDCQKKLKENGIV